jgi:hypothetical protein
MKVKILIATFGFIASISTYINAQPLIEKIFIPEGYDTTDVVEVVLKGYFLDACNTLESPLVLIDSENKIITITPRSYRMEQDLCVQMISPFTQVINLGRLLQGGYRINITSQPHIDAELKVESSKTQNTDNFLYAPVEYADVKKVSNSSITITLHGRYPLLKKGCMQIKGVIAHEYKNNVITLQPISEIRDDATCESDPVGADFSYSVALEKITAGETLIHVRTLNGGSYNRIVEIL